MADSQNSTSSIFKKSLNRITNFINSSLTDLADSNNESDSDSIKNINSSNFMDGLFYSEEETQLQNIDDDKENQKSSNISDDNDIIFPPLLSNEINTKEFVEISSNLNNSSKNESSFQSPKFIKTRVSNRVKDYSKIRSNLNETKEKPKRSKRVEKVKKKKKPERKLRQKRPEFIKELPGKIEEVLKTPEKKSRKTKAIENYLDRKLEKISPILSLKTFKNRNFGQKEDENKDKSYFYENFDDEIDDLEEIETNPPKKSPERVSKTIKKPPKVSKNVPKRTRKKVPKNEEQLKQKEPINQPKRRPVRSRHAPLKWWELESATSSRLSDKIPLQKNSLNQKKKKDLDDKELFVAEEISISDVPDEINAKKSKNAKNKIKKKTIDPKITAKNKIVKKPKSIQKKTKSVNKNTSKTPRSKRKRKIITFEGLLRAKRDQRNKTKNSKSETKDLRNKPQIDKQKPKKNAQKKTSKQSEKKKKSDKTDKKMPKRSDFEEKILQKLENDKLDETAGNLSFQNENDSAQEKGPSEFQKMPVVGETKGKETSNLQRVAHSLSSVKMLRLEHEGNLISAGKAFDRKDFTFGFIVIPPRARKLRQLTLKSEVFFVHESRPEAVKFLMNGAELKLSKGACFLVPGGNSYSIENTSAIEAILCFWICK